MVIGLVVVCGAACDQGSNRDARQEFLSHANASASERTKVVYTAKLSGAEQFSISLYLSGTPGRFRADVVGEDGTDSIFGRGDDWVSCEGQNAQVESGRCVVGSQTQALGLGAALLTPLMPVLVDTSASGINDEVTVISTRRGSALGRETECYTVRLFEGDLLTSEYCFSDDSTMLHWGQMLGGEPLEYDAVAEEAVTDVDFEPPYPIVDPD